MIRFRNLLLPALGSLMTAVGLGAATAIVWPTLTTPTTRESAPDADGFIPRWMILEPIPSSGLTDGNVQAEVKKEYFSSQLSVSPRDGDKVMVNDTCFGCLSPLGRR